MYAIRSYYGFALGQVAGDFQVQAQRGQVVAQQVVKLAGDAHALAKGVV